MSGSALDPRSWHVGLVAAIWFHVALMVFALVAMRFDTRVILGLNPWIKPLKFDVSTIVYLATIAVLLQLLTAEPWARVRIGWLIAVALVLENAIISLQSLRGVRSHMNFTTRLDSRLFAAMGLLILLASLAAAWLTFLYLKPQAAMNPALLWGIRLGLLVFLAGSFEGTLIVGNMGHTVGAADGGAGLPLVNWSRDHGDLRVAHFFALHGLQLMPLLGWVVGRSNWRREMQVAAVFALFLVYAVGVWTLFRQAMAGRPVL